jgi:hypothetical protein
VIINRQSLRDGRWWITASLALLLGSHLLYRVAAKRAATGFSGGSSAGLALAILGTAMIVFTMLLMVRKTWRTLRIGKAYAWLQGHVWIGLVSYPVIWYHAGWRWGGGLTMTLMVLFTAVWVSGIIGLLLQNLVPRWLFHHVPQETIYDQIDHVARENLKAARKLVRGRVLMTVGADAGDEIREAITTIGSKTPEQALLEFYERDVRPFLADGLTPGPGSWLIPWRPSWSAWLGPATVACRPAPPPPSAFGRMRNRYPRLFDALNALEDYVDQRRQHRLQKRLHWALHGWLLLHVPCSMAMVILIPLHAVLALRY